MSDGGRKLPALLTGVVFAAVAALLLYEGRDQILRGDVLEYASRLGDHSLIGAILDSPPDKYLLAVPIPLYGAMFGVFGLDADLPYRVLTTVMVLGCGYLFLRAARSRVGEPAALALAVLLMLFGPGWDTLLTATRLSSLISTAAGLGAVLALERQGRRPAILAAALLAISVGSHPGGLAWVAAAAVLIALRAPDARRAGAWVPLSAIAVFVAWVALLRSPSSPSGLPAPTIVDLIEFAWHSWVVMVADLSGLARITPDPSYTHTVNVIVAAVALAALVAVLARSRRSAPRLWSLAVAFAITAGAAPLAPAGTARVPDESRYLFPEALILLLIVVEVAAVVELRPALAWAGAAVLALGFVGNLNALGDGGDVARLQSQQVLGILSAYELAGHAADQSYEIPGLAPTPAQYALDSRTYGSAALPADAIAQASPTVQSWFGQALVESTGVALTSAHGPTRGRPPDVLRRISGTARAARGCARLTPADGADAASADLMPADPRPIGKEAIRTLIYGGATPTATVPQLAELRVQGGTLRFRGETHQPGILLGRAPLAPTIDPVAATTRPRSSMHLPELGDGAWTVLIGSDEPVLVCASASP